MHGPPTLDLRRLRHFEAVHRLASFRLAAEEQGLTQSALTRSIQKLEHELGVRLLDRTTRRVVATRAGDQLVQGSRELLRRADELAREAALIGGAELGEVVVGATPHPTESIVPPALRRFVEARSGVTVEVRTGGQASLVEQLLAHELDFAVLGGLGFEPIGFQDDVAIQGLPGEGALVAARHDHPVIVSDAPGIAYLDYPWAVPRLGDDEASGFPEPFRSQVQRRGFPQIRLESVSACLQLAAESDVLTGVPLSVGRRAEWAGLAVRDYPFEVVTRYAVLTSPGRTLSPAAAELRTHVAEAARAASAASPSPRAS